MDDKKRNQLVYAYSDMIFRIAIQNVSNFADAEDILQEVLIKLCYGGTDFRDDSHEKAWVIRVTINQCRDYHRLHWNKKRLSWEDIQKLQCSTGMEPSFSEIHIDLLNSLRRLSFEERNLFHLDYLGYTNREIAEILKINPNSVNSKLQKVRKKLRTYLENTDQGAS